MHGALGAVLGRKISRRKKCQGKYYDFFDEKVQQLKLQAEETQAMIKQARRNGEEVTELTNRYKTLMKSAPRQRLRGRNESSRFY